MDFLSQESLLYTFSSLRRNVSAWISLRKLIWIDILRRVHNVCFRVERLISYSFLTDNQSIENLECTYLEEC